MWQLQMIQLGLGQVVEATFEMFIPQMLNLQAAGAISFKKGCYTGQEVVARMKYLGKLKRRMYHLVIDAPVVP
ncbi:MAG: tRNA-modifying protein YgfZ [Porticoccaceae bacterium]